MTGVRCACKVQVCLSVCCDMITVHRPSWPVIVTSSSSEAPSVKVAL